MEVTEERLGCVSGSEAGDMPSVSSPEQTGEPCDESAGSLVSRIRDKGRTHPNMMTTKHFSLIDSLGSA